MKQFAVRKPGNVKEFGACRDSDGSRHPSGANNILLAPTTFASGALQISIVLASASIISGVAALAWIAGLLGVAGAVLMAFGYFAPTVLAFLS